MSENRSQENKNLMKRVLPWVLLSKFRNVILEIPLDNLAPGTHEIRNIEYYVSTASPEVHVPAASSLLYIPFIKFSVDIDKNSKEITVREVNGHVSGFFFDGVYRKFPLQNLEDEARKKRGPTTLTYDGEVVSNFDIESVLRTIYRLEAGKLFAAHLAGYIKKHYGVEFENLGRMKEINVVIEERTVSASLEMKLSLFSMKANGKRYTVPGIVPGILTLINSNALQPPDEIRDDLKALLNRIADVGERLSPVGGLLQSTNKARFTYVVGELDEKNEQGRRKWLTSDYLSHARVDFYANTRTGAVEMSITMYPFNPPAVVVLNYPPFNLAPLAGAIKDYSWILRRASSRAEESMRRLKLGGSIYIRELDRLSDAGISLRDVRQVLRDGYPSISRIEKMLDGFEKISSLGDILSLAVGNVSRVDKLLVTYLGKEDKEKEKKKTSVAKEEKEEEIVL